MKWPASHEMGRLYSSYTAALILTVAQQGSKPSKRTNMDKLNTNGMPDVLANVGNEIEVTDEAPAEGTAKAGGDDWVRQVSGGLLTSPQAYLDRRPTGDLPAGSGQSGAMKPQEVAQVTFEPVLPAAAEGAQNEPAKVGSKKESSEKDAEVQGGEKLSNPRQRAEEFMRDGEFAKAEEELQLEIRVLEKNENTKPIDMAMARYNLAHFYNEQGRYTEAGTELTKALASFNLVPDAHPLKKPGLALLMGDQGSLWLRDVAELKKAGKIDEAAKKFVEVEKAYTQSIEYLEGIKSPALKKMFEPGLKIAYKDYAWLLEHSERKEKAQEFTAKSDKLSDKVLTQKEFAELMAKEMPPAKKSTAAADMKKINAELDAIEERARTARTPAERDQVGKDLEKVMRKLECVTLGLDPEKATDKDIQEARKLRSKK